MKTLVELILSPITWMVALVVLLAKLPKFIIAWCNTMDEKLEL